MDVRQAPNTFRHVSSEHASYLLSNLHNLFLAQDFCDIKVNIGDQVFRCHKNVLSAASSYFHAMFSGGLAEMDRDKVVIQAVDPAIFEIILNFIYTGGLLEFLFLFLMINNFNHCSLLVRCCSNL